MNKKYFDEFEFNKALDLTHIDPYETLTQLCNYVTKYPKDYSARFYTASAYVSLKRFDEATILLEKTCHDMENDNAFMKLSKKKKNAVEVAMVYTKLKLLVYQDKYQECYETLLKHEKTITETHKHVYAVKVLCEARLGLIEPDHIFEDSYYLFNQIVNYKEDRFLEHIERHLIYDEEEKQALFSNSFPFQKIYKEIKNVPLENRIYNGLLEDVAYYKYDGCGTVENKQTDYFKVALFHGTNDFITIFPTVAGKYFPYIDVNYLREEKTPIKQKSRIDKFNEKYKNYC